MILNNLVKGARFLAFAIIAFTENDLHAQIDRLNRTTTVTYDVLDRPIIIQYIDAMVTWQYDAAGRRTRVDDTQFGGTFIARSFDNANRLLSESTPQGTVSYTYNPAYERTSMIAADRSPVSYTYDNASRLSTISQNLGQGLEVFTYTYDNLSRSTSLLMPNGINTVYEYDQTNRLKRLKHQKGTDPAIEDFLYTYNPDDEISNISSIHSSPSLPPNKSVGSADPINRISSFGTASYSFNETGQTISKTDSNGVTNYYWDHRGRLQRVTLPNGQEVSYSYDSLSRKISRTQNNSTTKFLYDGWEVVLDIHTDGSKVDYLNSLGVDEKLRQSNLSSIQYFLKDHLKTTIALSSVSGNIIEYLQYGSFGETNGSLLTRYGFTGREHENETDLTYYRTRWYDSQQGRFLSEDPIGLLDNLNMYVYVKDSPINLTDPTGLQSVSSFSEATRKRQEEVEENTKALDEYLAACKTCNNCIANCLGPAYHDGFVDVLTGGSIFVTSVGVIFVAAAGAKEGAGAGGLIGALGGPGGVIGGGIIGGVIGASIAIGGSYLAYSMYKKCIQADCIDGGKCPTKSQKRKASATRIRGGVDQLCNCPIEVDDGK
ncbi:MAG: RHS repeat-associated core domain-containing protein [Acidobacteria bacterium]|nr:RHS repeat-associated core domain-containing protein [Acidobacteriota bacterium]